MFNKLKPQRPFFLCLILLAVCLGVAILHVQRTAQAANETGKPPVDAKTAAIDQALFTRAEFFGTQALVPFPTAEARSRLAALQATYPNDPQIDLKLAQLDEKLGRAADAQNEMQAFVDHEPDKLKALETMAAFAHRRANFSAEAETLEKMLHVAPPEARLGIFQRLIVLGQTHLLEKYLAPAFFEATLKENPENFEIFEQYLDKLSETKDAAAALKVLRTFNDRFPGQRETLIEKEASLLEAMDDLKGAEAAYLTAFDPFWSNELSQSFYSFLREHDRYRAYGAELRAAFRRDPANFSVAVRLLHYENFTDNEAGGDVFVTLEKARGAQRVAWKPDELLTLTRLLLAGGYGDAASRFLYTLTIQGQLKPGSELRARMLYQIFEILSDAGDQRLSLTHGDLRFYQDIAAADSHPGMLGGILSLVLADSDPKYEFKHKEEQAVHHFNRAAAYRIFVEYKREYSTAPELAQMYLDIVRLYAASNEPTVAAETLAEFEQRYQDVPQYPEVALRLADCYVALGKSEEERRLYQQILDYLGQHRKPGGRLVPSSSQPAGAAEITAQRPQALDVNAEPTSVAPQIIAFPFASHPGIRVPATPNIVGSDDTYNSSTYPDYLAIERTGRRPGRNSGKQAAFENSVDYATVLARYVASLNKENRAADILSLYETEIKKYEDEQGLYEQMLQWLGQANMVDRQLRLYQEAVRKFPTTTWRDRLARWFINKKKQQDFETYSRDLLDRLNDAEVEQYLRAFVDSGAGATAASFEANLFVALYARAHERFPHNLSFVNGLLRFYSAHNDWPRWRSLLAEYYFVSPDVRQQFLQHLASRGELRTHYARASETLSQRAGANQDKQTLLPYELFRADSAAWLSNYEEAVAAYRELNRLYPNTPEFAERLIAFTRSFGQLERKSLAESAALAHLQAEAAPAVAEYRTRAGELQAELGDYARARGEWEQLIALGRGTADTYLETATVYWDYFQYDDALRTIEALRKQNKDDSLYAFQVGAILESKHQLPAALTEYVRALSDEGSDSSRAKNRLVKLVKRPGLEAQISLAYAQERARRPNDSTLALDYVDYLVAAKLWKTAAPLLRAEVTRNHKPEFLKRARAIFAAQDDADGESASLRQLVLVAEGPRLDISYRLQLAESYESAHQRPAAALVLRALVQKYPTNYGVLSEAADFYWRLGRNADSLQVLQIGRLKGIGKFHYLFGRKLAAREIELKHFAVAERVLSGLHREDPLNTEVFHELARLYVARNNRLALRSAFQTTLAVIKHQDQDLSGIRSQVAELRGQMIDAFTRLHDYQPAVEQHIEIINRNPEDEEKLNAAINYVKRYGGADTLLTYYQKTASQAFKNYRWNVVLARIYEAKGDLLNAARQYRAALNNQPEMLELYDSLAAIYTRAKDYDSALEALKKAAELSNDDPAYLKKMIEVLVKAGRHREAEIVRQKLPREQPQKLSVGDQFAEAARLRGSERKRAVATYRDAFNTFSAAPFKHDLQASEISGYVQTVREEDSLDQIMQRLWELRSRIVAEAEKADNQQAGKARAILVTLDSAVPEAVGGVATDRATGDELSALFSFLSTQIDASLQAAGDKSATLVCLQNLSRRAGFGALEERILVGQKDRARSLSEATAYHNSVRAQLDFYVERGGFRQAIDLLLAEQAKDPARDQFDYAQLLADNARLLGDGELELRSLREIYQRPASQGAPAYASWDGFVERYFEALSEGGDSNRAELRSCVEQPGIHHLQLINFLLRKGEKELAHAAITNARLSPAWQQARNAEASLALNEFTQTDESYFLVALQWRPIGDLITQKVDTNKQLVGDDWFRLTQAYGRWLNAAPGPNQSSRSRSFLPALIENRPEDPTEQLRLGRWYLEKKDAAHAVEHLRLAHEARLDDKQILADLGTAYLVRGNRDQATELWNGIIAGDASLDDLRLYLNTLTKQGLADSARKRLLPLLAKSLTKYADEGGSEGETKKRSEQTRALLRDLAQSFEAKQVSTASSSDRVSTLHTSAAGQTDPAVDGARAVFFRTLAEAAPTDRTLPELLIQESLIPRADWAPFYQMLIARSPGLTRYDLDYAYSGVLQKSWNAADAEEALDHETDYKTSEPDSQQTKWQKEYLAYLLERKNDREARSVVTAIETAITRRYARPFWLRLAELRLEIRGGNLAAAEVILRRLIGIENSVNVKSVDAPSVERLNAAAQMLREEGLEQQATALIEAAYARAVALEQYQPASFAGLATIAFQRGDAPAALKWLELLTNLSKEDLKAETQGELVSLPLIKKYVVDDPGAEVPEANNAVDQGSALRLAAEVAGRFGQIEAATRYRQELLTVSPNNEENRIELVRLLSAGNKRDAAVEQLAAIIGDRTATRNLRWQAIWLTPEIAEQKAESWANLRARARALNANDTEMAMALEALALNAANQSEAGVKVLNESESRTPISSVSFLRAYLEQQSGQEKNALTAYVQSLIQGRDSDWAPFAFVADPPLDQIVRLYLKQNQPRAALRVVERANSHFANAGAEASVVKEDKVMTNQTAIENGKYRTLQARAALRERVARVELLEFLSVAAERLGDFNRAITLEQTRQGFLLKGAERQAAQERIERLREQKKQTDRQPKPALQVDQQLVSGG